MKLLNKIFKNKEEFENSEIKVEKYIQTKINDTISGEVILRIKPKHNIKNKIIKEQK